MFECPDKIPTFSEDPIEHLVQGHGSLSARALRIHRDIAERERKMGIENPYDFDRFVFEYEVSDHAAHFVAVANAQAGKKFNLGDILPCGHDYE